MCIMWVCQYSSKRHVCTNTVWVVSVFNLSGFRPIQSQAPNCYHDSQYKALSKFWYVWSLTLLITHISWFGNRWTHEMFLHLTLLLEDWIEYVYIGLFAFKICIPTRIFWRGVLSFATDCPYAPRYHKWTTCMYVGPIFRNIILNDS